MILMFGDVHGDFSHVLPVVKREKPAAIIFLGDLQAQRPLEQELADVLDMTDVWLIHGNHDTDSQKDHDHLFGSAVADRNLHGRVVEIDGVRVAGLGGMFRGRIWDPVQSGKPEHRSYGDFETHARRMLEWLPAADSRAAALRKDLREHRSTIFYDEWYGLFGEPADILVTHEAPDCHRHGFVAVTELAQSMGVNHAFHGHHHDRLDYSGHEQRLGFSAHGVGLRGVSDMCGGVVCKGSLDERRMSRQKEVDRE